MPSFVYQAADRLGRIVDGRMDAESEAEATRQLEGQALVPVQLRRVRSKSDPKSATTGASRIRLRPQELLDFSRQLKVMLASGITVLSTLALLRQRARGNYQLLLDRIAAEIQRGATLSDALAAHPRTFDPFYVGTIRAGEAAGVHTEALTELIAYYERRAALRREVISALTYPAIVIVVLIAACAVLLTFVVPQFQGIFSSTGAQLPLPTRVLLGTSALVNTHKWLLVGVGVALGLAGWQLSLLPRVRSALSRLLANIPVLGQVFYLAGVIQFCRMTALLERSGLPVLDTLRIVGEMLMPGPIKSLMFALRRQVATGSSISDALSGTRTLPDLVQQMILVGEQTGHVDETLSNAAAHYEEEIRVKIKRLTILLEPALTIGISALVLGVALAIFLPLWQMNSLLLKK
jgi:type II secretory pathway component PulF